MKYLVLCSLLLLQVVLGQRASWEFFVSTFEPQFACNTDTKLYASFVLCNRACTAGTCSDRSIGRTMNLDSQQFQLAQGTSCQNANQGLTSTVACNSSGFSPSVCPIPDVWPKQCPVSKTCCVSNHLTVPDSVITGTGAEVRVLDPQLRVGYSNDLQKPLSISISARTKNRDVITLEEDPGVPIGMTATISDDNRSVTMVWTPRDGQEGFIPTVAINTAAGGSRAVLRLPVIAPVVSWVTPSAVAPAAQDTLVATVGATLVAPVQCASNYPGYISYARGFVPPEGASLVNVTEPAQYAWDGGLGVGATTGAIAPKPTIAAQFVYQPPHGAEGTEFTACFECTIFPELTAPAKDASTGGPAGRRCLRVHVPVCSYTAGPGDTLLSVSQRLYLNNNWRRLWNANAAAVGDPRAPLPVGLTLSLGPTYAAQPGDTLAIVAGRFSTTIKGLLEVNPFVNSLPDQRLPPGVRMCIPACSHKPTPSNRPGNPY